MSAWARGAVRDAFAWCTRQWAAIAANLRENPRLADFCTTLAQRHAALRERRAVLQEHRAAEREAAAAVLAGRPLPGEPVEGRKRRGKKARSRVVEFHPAPKTGWAVQMREALLAALHSLSTNRLRSLLTAVGIVVGVAAVIVLVALGNGMKAKFDDQFGKLANQITITPIKGSVMEGRVARNLTDRDVKALRDPQRAPDIGAISPAIVSNVTLTASQAKDKATLVGAVDNYLELLNRRMVAGRWFTEAQINGGARVVALGQESLNLLWGPGTPPEEVLGKRIRVGTSTFVVQGVVAPDGQNDNTAIVPFAAARSYLVGDNGGKIDMVIVKSTSVATLDEAIDELITVLDKQHRIHEATDRDYRITTYTELLREQDQYVNFLSMFIVAVAAISLFVGGIGVANIMLVSVTERTREIGIRKAIGAKTNAIMRQFLCEAVMLTGLGGLIGVVFGIAATQIGASVVPGINPDLPVPILTWSPVLIAFAVSLVIGVLAGGYPAHRAARLRPIEALRFE